MTIEDSKALLEQSSNRNILPIYDSVGICGVNIDIKNGFGCTVDRIMNILEVMAEAIEYLNSTDFDGILLISISNHIFKLENGYKLLYKVLSEYKNMNKIVLEIPKEYKYSKEEKYLKRKKIKIAYYDNVDSYA